MFSLYFDGASRGNPGPASLGGVIYDSLKEEKINYKKAIGIATNNYAEYQALLVGIKVCIKYDIKEVNVYGVLVPKQDGRAGMASIVVDDDFSIDGLYDHLQEQLPKYSVPLFIRISEKIEKTGTFKYKKVDLVKEGFDPNKISDQLYFSSMADAKYINLDKDLFSKINNQEVRV